MEWLVLALLVGLIPAVIAKKKGRSADVFDFGLWWLYGSLLLIVALPHALAMRPNHGQLERRRVEDEALQKCPFCAELIKQEAAVCRYCQRAVPPMSAIESPAPPPPSRRTLREVARDTGVLVMVVLGTVGGAIAFMIVLGLVLKS